MPGWQCVYFLIFAGDKIAYKGRVWVLGLRVWSRGLGRMFRVLVLESELGLGWGLAFRV